MKRKLALLLAAAAIHAPWSALALGLGNVRVESHLNEPLRAQIDLLSVKPGEAEDIKIALAGGADFRRAGLDRPFLLSKLRFKVKQDAKGRTFVTVTTRKAVREPFLNFLVEVQWPQGRLLREYTVLLDPPVYAAAAAARVQGPVIHARGGAATPTASPVSGAAPSAGAVVRHRAQFTGDRYGPTGRSDTLWSIANRVRPEGVSVQQMMLALLRANPEAFLNDNINSLKAGYVLRVPAASESGALDQAEAVREVRRQGQAWRAYREGRSALPGVPSESVEVETEGVTAAPRGPRVEIVSAGSSERAVGGQTDVAGLSKELAVAHEDLDSKRQENEELNSRLAEAEALVDKLRHLLEMKDDTLAALQAQLAAQEGGATPTTEGAEPTMPLEPGSETASAGAPPEGGQPAGAEGEGGPESGARGPGALGGEALSGGPEVAEAGTPSSEPAPGGPEVTEAEAPPGAAEGPPMIELGPPAETSMGGEGAEGPRAGEPTSIVSPPETLAGEPESGAGEATPPGAAEGAPTQVAVVTPPPSRPTPVLPLPSAPKEESFFDDLPVSPLFLGGSLGLLVLLGGAALLIARRQRTELAETSPAVAALEAEEAPTAEERAPAVEEREAQTEVAPAVAAEAEPAMEEAEVVAEEEDRTRPAPSRAVEEDPLAEVNVYLAYERFDQAEALVRKAIQDHPDRHDYLLKMLEIHYAAKDKEGFSRDAIALRQAVGDDNPLMERAMGWWQDLAPGEPLSADRADTTTAEQTVPTGTVIRTREALTDTATFTSTAEFPAAETTEEGAGEIDFDLGLGPEEQNAPEISTGDLDFDLGLPEAEEGAEAQAGEVDFDLPLEEGSSEERPPEGEVDFDLGLEEVGEEAEEDQGLDFDLGLPEGTGAEAAGIEALETEQGLDFDLGEEALEPSEGAVSEEGTSPFEAGLDLEPTLEPAAEEAPEAERPVDLDEGLDFDLGTGLEEEITAEPVVSGPATRDAVETEVEEVSPGPGAGLELAMEREAEERGEEAVLGEAFPPSETEPEEELGAVDFDLGIGEAEEAPPASPSVEGEAAPEPSEALPSEIDFDLDLGDEDELGNEKTLALGREVSGDIDEIGTKLDLAQAYIDMGDVDGAKGILNEVLSEGDETQQQEAQALMEKLS